MVAAYTHQLQLQLVGSKEPVVKCTGLDIEGTAADCIVGIQQPRRHTVVVGCFH